jgi:hypothetical protein
VIACAYQSEDGEADSIYQWKMRESFRRNGGDEKCGICGSTELHLEDGATKWATLEEAEPILRAEEARQAFSRHVIDEMKKAGKN